MDPYIKKKTGLLIDAYFSGTKIKWILDHVDGARKRAEKGEILFGNVDSWLIWNLTGGKVHVSDYSNCSRTMLFNIDKLQWDEDICKEHISCKNNKFVSFCFDCNCHLCEECLKSRAHICHNKNNIIEIKPIKEELNIVEEVIKYYKNKIEKLKNEKINKIKELDNYLDLEKINEDKKIKNKIEINKKSQAKELKLNHDKYISDIEAIKKRYEKEIKDRENKYKKDEDKINNKYKIMNEKEYSIHKLKIDELCKKYKE